MYKEDVCGTSEMEKNEKKVTVVIPNFNGMAHLPTCLASLKKQTYQEFDTIMVDNASTDESLSWVRREYPEVNCLVLDRNYGFSGAVNEGIRASETPYVLLLNNDIEADEHLVEELLLAIEEDKKIFSCQAKMLRYFDREKIDDAGDFYCILGWALGRGKGKSAACFSEKKKIFSACAGAALYRREVFEEIGLFDEAHFAYLEDVDVGYRARIYGYENIFAPKAVVYHKGSATSGGTHNAFKVRLSAQNSLYLAYKNMPTVQFVLNFPFLWLGSLIKWAYFTRKGLGTEYRQGRKAGKALCKKETRVPYSRTRWKNYVTIQCQLWKNLTIPLDKGEGCSKI